MCILMMVQLMSNKLMCRVLSRKYCHITCMKYKIKGKLMCVERQRDMTKKYWETRDKKPKWEQATAILRNIKYKNIIMLHKYDDATCLQTYKNGWEVFFTYARQMTREKLYFFCCFSLSHSHWFHFHSFLHTLHALIFPFLLLFHLIITKKSRCEIHWFLCH